MPLSTFVGVLGCWFAAIVFLRLVGIVCGDRVAIAISLSCAFYNQSLSLQEMIARGANPCAITLDHARSRATK